MDPETPQADATPPVVAAPPAPAPAPVASPETTDDAPTLTPAEARELRREAQSLRRRLRELEGQQTTSQQEATAQVATLQAELDALRASHSAAAEQLRAYRLRDAIAETATGDDADDLRGLNPDLAARLIEGVEWDEQDNPKGLATALRKLLKRYPQIAAPAPRVPSQPPAGGNGRTAASAIDADLLAQKRRQVGAI